MVELGALRAVNERLKPLRRLMDDLQLSAEMLGDVEGRVTDRQTALSQLEEEIQGRQGELNDLSANLAEAADLFDKERADMQTAKYLAQAELVVFREGLEREKREMLAETERLTHEANEQHVRYMAALAAQKQAATAEYDSLCAARDALKAQIKGLL